MDIKSLFESKVNELISEAMNLDKVHHSEFGEHAAAEKEFAKHYAKGKKGDYADGGPTKKHEKDSEFFHNNYEKIGGKSGFAGSGTSIYKHKKTGDKFAVNRSANGKGFHGTDHYITKLED